MVIITLKKKLLLFFNCSLYNHDLNNWPSFVTRRGYSLKASCCSTHKLISVRSQYDKSSSCDLMIGWVWLFNECSKAWSNLHERPRWLKIIWFERRRLREKLVQAYSILHDRLLSLVTFQAQVEWYATEVPNSSGGKRPPMQGYPARGISSRMTSSIQPRLTLPSGFLSLSNLSCSPMFADCHSSINKSIVKVTWERYCISPKRINSVWFDLKTHNFVLWLINL